MDPVPGEKLNYEEEEYGGPKEMQYSGGGAISAPTGDELSGGEDDDNEMYDELYGDLNIGDGFYKFDQVSETPDPLLQTPKTTVPEPAPVNLVPKEMPPMDDSYMSKFQVQLPQSGRRPLNDNAGRSGRTNYPAGDPASRGYGRGQWARGQGGDRHMRGIIGANWGGYEQGMRPHAFGGPPVAFMYPQGAAFHPTSYMAPGFPGPAFGGMMPPFQNLNAMEISGVSPPVNPAFHPTSYMAASGMGMMGNAGMDGRYFFGSGMAASGMRMMGHPGMDGRHSGMWNETNAGGWGQEPGQRIRESSFGSEEGNSEYGYGNSSHGKGPKSNVVSPGKSRGSERDWSGNFDKRHRDESDHDRERYDREHRYRELRYSEEKDDYRKHRQRDPYLAHEDDRDWRRTSATSRSRPRVREESRDADHYGKRRRLQSP